MSGYVSSVEMDANLAALFFRDIGEKIDLNMFNKKRKDDKLIKLYTHKQIIDLIESMGFEKKGFSGYKPPRNGISKGQMKTFFSKVMTDRKTLQRDYNGEKSKTFDLFEKEIVSLPEESKIPYNRLSRDFTFEKTREILKEIRKQERKISLNTSKYLLKVLEGGDLESLESKVQAFDQNFESIKSIIGVNSDNLDKLSSGILSFIIPTEKDYKLCAALEYQPKENKFFTSDSKNRKQNQKELYSWQKDVIDSVVHQGKSIIVRGPTNGGKTFVGLSVIEHFVSKTENFAFIVPTTYLAAQTYSNIINTFGHKCNVNLLAGSLCVNSSSLPNIVVGTPEPVWVWLRNHPNFKFDRMIVDEIHTISSPGLNRGFAIRNIIKRCKKQFLGLSATIHDDDLIELTKLVSENGVKCDYLKYDDRPIPLMNQRFSGGEITSIKGEQDANLIPEINPRNTLKLIRLIKEKQRLPCLIFDESDSTSWDQFVEFCEFLIYLDSSISPEWTLLKREIDEKIERYNSTHRDSYQEYCNVYSEGNQKKISLLSSNYKIMASERAKLVKTSFERCKELTKSAASKVLNSEFDEYLVPVDDTLKKRFKALSIKHTESVYPGVIDLLNSLELLKETKDHESKKRLDDIEPLGMYFSGVSPWIRFSDSTESNNLSQMLRSDRKTDQRDHMLRMCSAESIKDSDVDDLFRILEKGARYGIVSLLPSLPNVIQIEILKLFNCRAINIVFTSQDMSMGVNFPVVTSVVRCTSFKQSMPVNARIQAEGRAGRKGRSDFGYSITWNIMNDHIKEFPRLQIPKLDENKGCYLNNINRTVESLYTHYICSKDIARYFEKIREKLFRVVVNKKKVLTEADIERIENRDREVDCEVDGETGDLNICDLAETKKSAKSVVIKPKDAPDFKERNVNDVWRSTCVDLIEKLEEFLGGNEHKANIVGNFLCDSVIKGIGEDLKYEKDLVKEIEVKDKNVAEKILKTLIEIDPSEENIEILNAVISSSDLIEDRNLIDSVMGAYEELQDSEFKESVNNRIVIYRMIELIDSYINSLQELINYPQYNLSKVLSEKNEIFAKMTDVGKIESITQFKTHLIEMFRGMCQAKYRCMKHLR